MLNLTVLELILSDLMLVKLRALPETMIIGCKTAGVGVS
jgi:hypothetical protein